MAGLVPAIHELQTPPMRGGWVYILTNRPNGIPTPASRATLRDAPGSIGKDAGFTRRYGVKRLVWCEHHETIAGAIQREHNMKHWPRAWKVRLILTMNPNWDDLYERLNQ
jgi:putative endonuclease